MRSTLILLLLTSAAWSQNGKVFTKPFVLTHAAYLGSVAYDAEMTHQGLAHHHCVEGNGSNPHPSRGDLYRNSLIFFAAITAVDVGLQAAHIKFAPYIGPAVGVFKHVRGGTQWAIQCW